MIVIPALDLRAGKVVRMERGDIATSTVYAENPVAQAKEFVAQGARQLHVIDLDAALGHGDNMHLVAEICRAVDVPVTVGGGIRGLDKAQQRIDAGAAQIVLGTMLVAEERTTRAIIGRFPDRVVAGIDVRGKHVSTHGWQENTPIDRDALIKRVVMWGIKRIIFTEIRRDGMGEGYDIAALTEVASVAEVPITANGGARTIDDLRALKAQAPPSVDSCIVGSAIYKGTIKLVDAIAAVG
ncbi:MAG TPA: HisA/HisF-related TIM barrel protein [Candidatus Acidoferrum sp.]|jgi:phosphoribosylformimino-5-aminoimidazole carboxamide ribotide isomerase|nr:HisA/HisF-related TIM barrel protein [Candidatus Acidoferrum sp.]